jgi:hypothetical protein
VREVMPMSGDPDDAPIEGEETLLARRGCM